MGLTKTIILQLNYRVAFLPLLYTDGTTFFCAGLRARGPAAAGGERLVLVWIRCQDGAHQLRAPRLDLSALVIHRTQDPVRCEYRVNFSL